MEKNDIAIDASTNHPSIVFVQNRRTGYTLALDAASYLIVGNAGACRAGDEQVEEMLSALNAWRRDRRTEVLR